MVICLITLKDFNRLKYQWEEYFPEYFPQRCNHIKTDAWWWKGGAFRKKKMEH